MAAFDGHELDATHDDEPDENDQDEPEAEPGANYPTLYVDGETQTLEEPWELERVQVEFDAAANGTQSEADEAAPLGWVNSAAITLDRDEDAVHVSISVGDPRGAFAFTIRRLPADLDAGPTSPLRPGMLLMHLPTPADGMLHMPLTLDHEGTYRIG